MIRPDYIHMQNIIIGAITSICRDDNAEREVEMSKMVHFLTDMHSTAVVTLAGAVLVSAKMELDKEEPDQSKVDQMLTAVMNLIEATDASFSMQMRSKIMSMVKEHEVPNPFEFNRAEGSGRLQ